MNVSRSGGEPGEGAGKYWLSKILSVVKKIIIAIGTIIPIIAGLAVIANNKSVLYTNYIEPIILRYDAVDFVWFSVFVIFVSLSFLLIFFLIYIVLLIPKGLGGKAGKMDISAVLYLLNPVMYYTVLQKIHEFQHNISETLRSIHYEKISLEDPSFREKVSKLLFVCGDISQTLIGKPVSVNIKLFRPKNDDSNASPFKGKLSEAKLKTFVRAPSKAEYEDCRRNGKSRRNVEEFEIVLGDDNKPELLKKRYSGKSDAARVNTAYNQVLGPRDHFGYICVNCG